jgi:16S rRNA G966 N2-methylase RsmD
MIDNWVTHPAADLFPLIEGDEFAQLVDDIRVNGLLEPVWVLPDGSLLDGRNRVRACERAGVEVVSRVYEGDDPVGFVLSLNVQRRHLSTGQRAMLALRVEELLSPGRGARTDLSEQLPAELQEVRRKRESTYRAAVAVGTSGRAVSQAKRVAQQAPDLAEKVRSGEIALDRAERIVRDREAAERRIAEAQEQRQHIEQGTTVRIEHGDFRKVLADLRNVDAIITDPPYPAEFVPLLDDLRDFADEVLAPDGVLVVLFGQTYLPEVFRRLEGGRPYRWTGAFMTPGAGYASMARRVQSNWKPVLVYGGGERFGDVFQSEGKDAHAKDLHHWGQDYGGFHQLVERLTKPGQTVVDPFMGSGTTLLAAQALGRHAIGCDIDVKHVGTAARRLGV